MQHVQSCEVVWRQRLGQQSVLHAPALHAGLPDSESLAPGNPYAGKGGAALVPPCSLPCLPRQNCMSSPVGIKIKPVKMQAYACMLSGMHVSRAPSHSLQL